MRIPLLLALFAAAGLAALAAPPDEKKPAKEEEKADEDKKDPKIGENLILNGDFEEGDLTPKHWQIADCLCSYYVKDDDPKHGMVMKFDTDVDQGQAYEWWVKIANGVSPKMAPKKKPTVPPKYDTVAGIEGTWFYSALVPIKTGKAYWLSLDVKGPEIMVWLIGYKEKVSDAFGADRGSFLEILEEYKTGKKPDRSRNFQSFINRYNWKGQLKAGGPNEWRTYSRRNMPFRPSLHAGRPSGVKYVRVLLYPYWPPGEYFVDNVKLVELADDDPRAKQK